MCYADSEFSLSVCQAVARDNSECLHQRSTSSVGRNEQDGAAQEGVPNNAISTPKLADFLVNVFEGWPGLVYNWYLPCSAISAF